LLQELNISFSQPDTNIAIEMSDILLWLSQAHALTLGLVTDCTDSIFRGFPHPNQFEELVI